MKLLSLDFLCGYYWLALKVVASAVYPIEDVAVFLLSILGDEGGFISSKHLPYA